MCNVKITLFPAQNGDSLLISNGEQFHMLIDTGYKSTYVNYLKPTLQQLALQKIELDYCIITHVDADHIEGAVKGLFLENGLSNDPEIISIRQVWHNSYKHLRAEGQKPISDSDKLALRAIVAKGMDTTVKEQSGSREISTHQGSSLGTLLTHYQYPWNSDFGNSAVVGPSRLIVNPAIEFTILSPTETQLNRLTIRWKADLLKLGIQKDLSTNPLLDEAYEYWLAQHNKHIATIPKPITARSQSITDFLTRPFQEDNSLTNGSSIAFVFQANETRLLLLGDAFPSVIEGSLKIAYPDEKTPMWFDAIKVSHHGSFANNSPALIQLTDSSIYLFSTDGSKHNHPDPETVAWIVTRPLSRGTKRRLYFNYKTPNSQLFENLTWQEQYNYRVLYSIHDVPIEITL